MSKNKLLNNLYFYVFWVAATILVGYLAVHLTIAFFYQKTYTIDFNKDNFNNEKLPLYLNTSIERFASFGQTQDSQIYAEVISTPLYFVFKPEEFPLEKNITITITMQTNDDWDIAIFCASCPKAQKLEWQPLALNQLNSNYWIAAFVDGYYIYAKQDRQWQKANNLGSWLDKNTKAQEKIEIITAVNNRPTSIKGENIFWQKTKDPDFIITDFYISQTNTWIKASRDFKWQELKKKGGDFKQIKFAIRNKALNIKTKQEKKILDLGMMALAKFNDYKLYGRKNLSIQTGGNLNSWLENNLPPTSTLYIDETIKNKIKLNNIKITNKLTKKTDFILFDDRKHINFLKNIQIYVW